MFHTVNDITPQIVKELGLEAILFDLDNTCVPFKDTEPNKKLIDLFEMLKDMGF